MSLADDQNNNDTGPAATGCSPTRPSSAWTSSSVFADSAVSLRSGTPVPSEKEMHSFQPPEEEPPSQCGIADRLHGLVSEIWVSEQDGAIRADKRRKIEKAMAEIEAALEEDSIESEDGEYESDAETGRRAPSSSAHSHSPAAPTVTDAELDHIRTHLASTVESMRMRQQEQRHLHQLTVEKLEAVAQRCIQQETRLRGFAKEMVLLRERNRQLTQENERVNVQLIRTRSESAKKEIAVDAMSSAVAGLEGWINGSPTPNRSTPRRVVTRGRGRFRGRYYLEDANDGPVGYGLDGASDAKLLHEGVTAWLRGFRDVEEELRSSRPVTPARAKELQEAPETTADEWGEFETATGT